MPRGAAPLIIPVFLPHAGCRYRCVFCNQLKTAGDLPPLPTPARVAETIRTFLDFPANRNRSAQIAFYGGTFLGLEKPYILSLLETAGGFAPEGGGISIRFSTRPDTVDSESLDLIREFPVSTVEIGAQSMDDSVLRLSKRGHTADETETAVRLLKRLGYEVGVQLMVGLPGESEESAFRTARRIIRLSPDFVRIYPALVLSGSRLEKWYAEGRYTPLTLERSVTLVKHLYLEFTAKRIRVIRMGLQANSELDTGGGRVAGPYHPAFGHLVHSEIFLDRAESVLSAAAPFSGPVALKVNPRSLSRLQGLGNRNLDLLKRKFALARLDIRTDPLLDPEKVVLCGA
jgi:histone acetyltransferase (RNA polymerase elongator complex component)